MPSPDDQVRAERDADLIERNSAQAEGGLVLYSGPGNAERAEQYAKDGSHYRLDDTAVGRTLLSTQEGEPKNIYAEYDDPAVADQTMRQASVKCCAEAQGDVNTFVVGAREDRIFRSEELPTLVQNEHVNSINGIPRQELAELHRRDSEAAFNRVCEAELQRDREHSQTAPDPEHRQALYREQLMAQGRDPDRAGEATQPMSQQERGWRRQAAAQEQEQEQERVQEEHQKDGPDR